MPKRIGNANIHLRWAKAVCAVGIGLAVLLLHMSYAWLGLNLYVASFMAILLVTLWNFWTNAMFNLAGTISQRGRLR